MTSAPRGTWAIAAALALGALLAQPAPADPRRETALKSVGKAARVAAAPAVQISPLPALLSGTGLYRSGSTSEVAPQNWPYSPQYPLWSDGALKRRWISLPLGTTIDASNP